MSLSLSLTFNNQTHSFQRPLVMGILNITPDSFSDGGGLVELTTSTGTASHNTFKPSLDKILRLAEEMIADGVDIFDVGGESTRPGAEKVSCEQELDRVLPVVEALISRFDVPVSVDTSNPILMTEVGKRGAAMINDVRALSRLSAIEAVAESDMAVCLMHMQGSPVSMQENPEYNSVVDDVGRFLSQRAQCCIAAGIAADRIILDPGFGFGKTLEQNLTLFNALGALQNLGYPLLVGVSRKSMIGSILNKEINQRLAGGLALGTLAVWQGAQIVRTHDVSETCDTIKIVQALKEMERT